MEKRRKFELAPLQQKVLHLLAQSSLKNHFYWTGGTALAFMHLQHRNSEDIDLFSDHPFPHTEVLYFVRNIQQSVKLKKMEEKQIFSRHEFFLYNDSLTDMAANKTLAMLDRHEPKDVFDVYFLIQKKRISPKKLISLVAKKFGIVYPLSSFWSQGLFAATMLSKINPLLLPTSKKDIISEIVNFFEKEGSKEMSKHLFN